MNIRRVLSLKKRIASAAGLFARDPSDGVLRFAIGVGLTDTPDDYRLALRAKTVEDETLIVQRFSQYWEGEDKDVDLQVIGHIRIGPSDEVEEEPKAKRELAIGDSISHFDGGAGTLGFFAERTGVRGFVSCNHVIARVDDFGQGDPVISPPKKDGGTVQNDIAGSMAFAVSLHGAGRKQVDCAFAEAAEGRFPANPSGLGADGDLTLGTIVLRSRLPVIKQGRHGRTEGRVSTRKLEPLDAEYAVNTPQGVQVLTVPFYDVIEIESTTKLGSEFGAFCLTGDSGSLVYTTKNEPVGLLFYKANTGGPDNSGYGYMGSLLRVLKALDAKLLL